MLPDAVDFAFGTLLKKQVLKGGGSGLMTFSYGAMETYVTETRVSGLEEEARRFKNATDNYHSGKGDGIEKS